MMYKDPRTYNLLKKLLSRFIIETKKRNHTSLIIAIPQLLDLRRVKGNLYYQSFFLKLSFIHSCIRLDKSFSKY